MPVFPQLTTRVMAVYPAARRSIQRSVMNVAADGSSFAYADVDAETRAWDMDARGLTRAEWNALDGFFRQVSGTWQTFTFLDPLGNLLARSEDFTATEWAKGALIQLIPGVSDPLGTQRATQVTNGAQNSGAVAQTLAVPGDYQYCFSVWSRSSGAASLTLKMGAISRTFNINTQWRRIYLSGSPGAATQSVVFGIEVAAGSSVDVFGAQVEPQLGPGDYKRTATRSGVYTNARFASDDLTVTAQGTDVFDAVLRIISVGN
jgi:hypothetical protein